MSSNSGEHKSIAAYSESGIKIARRSDGVKVFTADDFSHYVDPTPLQITRITSVPSA